MPNKSFFTTYADGFLINKGETGASVSREVDTEVLNICGGSDQQFSILGATIKLYGGSHATDPDKIEIIQNGATVLEKTQSGAWDFQTAKFRTGDNIELDVAGKGIDFGATGATTTLDYYKEGTWTPVVSDGTNSATASTAAGFYTRIGRQVFVYGRVILTSLGSVSGAVRITGLPLTAANTASYRGTVIFNAALNMSFGTAGTYMTGNITENTSYIDLQSWDVTGGSSATQSTELTSTSTFNFYGSYIVAT